MSGLFITGTDTGVGKTVVTALLLRWIRARGVDAAPMKPVQTGWPADNDIAACGEKMTPLNCPYHFRLRASPHLAGRVDLSRILRAYRTLARAHECVLVEGAGGVLVPLNERATMLDLMKRLRLPVLVVARAGLGTLNHTMLTLNELRRARLRVLGVALNPGRGPWGRIEQSNLATLRARADGPVERLFSNDWKNARKNFQSLEKILGSFPILLCGAAKRPLRCAARVVGKS